MFVIKNLRKEKAGKWTCLKVDLEVKGGKNPFTQDTIWFAVENKNANMLADDVYDAFVPFVLYLGMAYHQDVHVEGEMSPLLYHNLTHYVMTIFNNFSRRTQPIKLTIDGLKIAEKGKEDLIGAGFSCGVDSMNTLYSNFVMNEDERFRVNSLFFFNCGQNGEYGEEKTKKVWQSRINLHEKARKAMGLPAYYIDSNLHAFYSQRLPISHIGYIGLCCCVLSVQKSVRRYYFANNLSYDEILKYGLEYRDKDIFEYSESFLVHLLSTELLEIVIDGCEFTRAEKLERIQDWDIARKNLDVCVDADVDGRNCSKCSKCMRTLLVLDAMGKLDNFKDVFDLETYRSEKLGGLLDHLFVSNGQNDGVIKYLKERNFDIPPKIIARPEYFLIKVRRKIDWIRKHGTWRPEEY